jgi:hypothetical protein
MLDLVLELVLDACAQLGLRDLVRIAAVCRRFRHGAMETVELSTDSAVVTALRQHAFPGGDSIPSTCPVDCSESWVTYLARCARQRRFRDAPPIAAGRDHSLFVDAAGQLLACGTSTVVGHGDRHSSHFDPVPVRGC